MNVIRQIVLHVFSVYLVVLMVLPCSEAHASNIGTAMQHSHNHNQSDDTGHQGELCTPFCVCGSCVVAVMINPVLEIIFLQPEKTSTEIQNFYSSFKSDFFGSIWQPPKIV